MSTWGPLRRTATVPLAFFAPPHASSGSGAEFNAPGPAVRAWDLGRDVPPEPPWARPPSRVLSWGAQRQGIGGGMVEQTRTHSTGSETQGKTHSADALAAANSVPLAFGVMPDAEGIPLRPKGSSDNNIFSYSESPTGFVPGCNHEYVLISIFRQRIRSIHIETLSQPLCLIIAIYFGLAIRRNRCYAHLCAGLARAS